MIHINTVNINVQMPCDDEPSPTSGLDDALLHAMAESIFAEQPEQPEELDSEVEVQPPINPARMNSLQQQADDSLQQQADAWKVVCATLNEVCPGWCNGAGSAADQVVSAIRAMAKATR